jgi:hypothetical protein
MYLGMQNNSITEIWVWLSISYETSCDLQNYYYGDTKVCDSVFKSDRNQPWLGQVPDVIVHTTVSKWPIASAYTQKWWVSNRGNYGVL